MSTVVALLRLTRPPLGRLALAVTLGAVAVLTGVGLMTLAGYLISRCAEQPPVLSLTVAIVGVRAFGIARPLARYAHRLVSHDLALRSLAGTRAAAVRSLAGRLPDRSGTDRDGDLLARLVGDVDAMQDLYLRGLIPPLVALASGAVSVAVATVLLPAAGVLLAAGLVVGGVLVPMLAAGLTRSIASRRVTVRAELTADLVEVLRGAPELVVLGADTAAVERIERLDAELTRLGRRDALAGAVTEGLSVLVAGLTTAGVLAVCVLATADHRLDRVLVAALTLLAAAAFEAVAPLPPAALGLRSTLESARRVLQIRARPPAVLDPDHPAPGPGNGPVVLERVGLRPQDADGWGLHDVDLTLAPGDRVALVGRSGSGKTTLAQLLVRFLDPDDGRVLLAGTDVRGLTQRDLRRRVTLDGQDAYLFATSILENVRLARPEADDAAVLQALRRARLTDWMARLPQGWDTLVGEDGAAVSGGERRRIALARALLADSPVLVLDEPTAHVDRPTAAAIVEDVLGAGPDRTVLLVTHREEEAALTPRVLHLRRGRITPGSSPQDDDL
jgi:ATP-binding cassette subfamily C protein CydC/ATP-binding cassette subfamily C protein CydCD